MGHSKTNRSGEDKVEKELFSLIPEEELGKRMTDEVEPYLQGICRKGRFGEGDALSYELFLLPDSRATVVFSHGFVEAGCKYHELIYYFLQAGYSCAILDHRGHGESVREGADPNVVHVGHFDQYVEDFHTFVHEIVFPAAKGPFYLYGHSMGGCIAARYLEEYPQDFERAVLNAPMLGIQMGGIPQWAAILICNVNIWLKKGNRRLFFHKDFNPDATFEEDCATSRARFEYYHGLRRSDKNLQTSSASYVWVKESILAGRKACALASKIQIPVLMFQAGDDTLVTPKPQQKFVAALTRGQLVKITGSKHEIYRSGNQVLEKYLNILFSFYSA